MKNKIKKIVAFLCVLALGVGAMAAWTPTKEVKAETSADPTPVYLEGFKHVTLSSFETSAGVQMEDGTYDKTAPLFSMKDINGNKVQDLDKTLVSFKVSFNTAGTSFVCLGGSGDGKGFGFQPSGSGKSISIVNYDVVNAPLVDGAVFELGQIVVNKDMVNTDSRYADSMYNVAALGQDFAFKTVQTILLQVSFEYYDSTPNDTDTTKNSLRLGVYVNGKLVKISKRFSGGNVDEEGRLLMSVSDSTKANNGTCFDCAPGGGAITVASVISEKTDLTKLVWSDFKNSADRVYMSDDLTCPLDSSKKPNITKLGATSFEANVRFTSGNANERIYYGGKSNWYGPAFYIDDGVNLKFASMGSTAPTMVSMSGTNFHNLTFLPATAIGEDSFVDTEFTLKVSTNYGDYDNDGYVDDVEFGFYFNGELYDNRYVYLLNYLAVDEVASEHLGNCIGIYSKSANDAEIMIRSTPEGKEVLRDISELTDGTYTTLVTDFTDVASVYAGDTLVEDIAALGTAGDYLVKDASGQAIGQVILYESGDTHPDGVSDVKDLVAMIKVNANLALDTWAGTMGAYKADFSETTIINELLGITAQ